ncbi:hypothetical protein MJO28_008729 [Puccinia striiformis f. sp. tritici]|uniref:Uncharacterized protein n=1 Tax=Puccinia striiformis f. sp. tritici TaxID=168172 RepID=A0ACC0ECM1_9BASI|nr:hypothetical protein MJO28_008729 [Puccinia striiformis f. sp. tritici]KAI7952980.1 hypothetical protein MJO29_008611 [Puccinia striiformis f. sp. tritici]
MAHLETSEALSREFFDPGDFVVRVHKEDCGDHESVNNVLIHEREDHRFSIRRGERFVRDSSGSKSILFCENVLIADVT